MSEDFDLLIIGSGITRCSLYNRFVCSNKKVLLVENNDFGLGTSQASGMMIWGGLLYLKQFHLIFVWTLCKARDLLVKYILDDLL